MQSLLAKFSIEEIIIFIVLLCFAVKEAVTFFDWAHSRLKTKFKEEDNKDEIKEKISEMSNYLETNIENFKDYVKSNKDTQEKMQKTIDLLVESDKDDIKAWITEKHHYFCYEKGYIDDYNLDCMEKRFKHYQEEKGNSFAGDLMNEVRALPKVSQSGKPKH